MLRKLSGVPACRFVRIKINKTKEINFIDIKFNITIILYTQNKLVFENIIFQFIESEYNSDRIFCKINSRRYKIDLLYKITKTKIIALHLIKELTVQYCLDFILRRFGQVHS